MQGDCSYIHYANTGFFSNIVIDYLQKHSNLSAFYQHKPSLQGIKDAIAAREKFPQQRTQLVQALQQQYQHLPDIDAVQQNLVSLNNSNTFTVTTAHQPNIFTGPLYFIYKILHAIQLAEQLTKELPAYKFVPVYYMGSEDADLDELGSISLQGKKYTWNTRQTGAVGRMLVDDAFIQLINEMQGQLGVLPYGNQLIHTYHSFYTVGKSIQLATLELLHHLFGKYGLVVLVPDNAALKTLFEPVVKKELLQQFSAPLVHTTAEALSKHYKVQASGRELNLFYLINDKRERIEKIAESYIVKAINKIFTESEILDELSNHPERFSANVILRGVFQETILPNIAFIGGGGEIAYWLELKQVFEAVQVPYPLLILRNSYLIASEKEIALANKLGITLADAFKGEQAILKEIVSKKSDGAFEISTEIAAIEAQYTHIAKTAFALDATLEPHVQALKAKALQKMYNLQKKLYKAEKQKFVQEQKQVHQLVTTLFPNDNLQERVENMGIFYAKYSVEFIDILYKYALGLEQQFALLTLSEA